MSSYPLATVVANSAEGLLANHIPLLMIADADGNRSLIGHIAKANEMHKIVPQLGRRLMDFVENYLRPLCDRYQLYTNAKMKRNIGWDHALGFTQTFSGVVDGYDRIYFEKRFCEGQK